MSPVIENIALCRHFTIKISILITEPVLCNLVACISCVGGCGLLTVTCDSSLVSGTYFRAAAYLFQLQ